MEEMRSEAATGPRAAGVEDMERECRLEGKLKQADSQDSVVEALGH